MMMPVARLALLRAYPRSELLPVLNFVTMPGLVGPILGPVLGGVFVTWASWHWIFLINIPIGVIGILYARKFMPLHDAAQALRYNRFSVIWLKPGTVFQRY